MIQQVLNSHAKINVGLRILGKREDGFHELETIFYPVKLRDIVTISLKKSEAESNSVILKSNKSYVPLTRENLCYIALEKFFKAFSIKDCFNVIIDIEKNIPVSGGLGGGSSNAAAVIKFLVRELKIDIPSNKEKLIDLAKDIGSDVPFFLLMRPCYAEGRGELMNALPNFVIDYDILIVNPNARVSTRWAFEKMALTGKGMKERTLDKIRRFKIEETGKFINDFEPVVFERLPELKRLKHQLIETGAVYASLSGSGATMYGLYSKNEQNKSRKAIREFTSQGYFTYISRAT
jgi:4-diphosphocytidyl-2-C-methyl-D-erythritol kinase